MASSQRGSFSSVTAAPDIFLSYNREDQATARRFAEAFERQGFKVWWDATLRSGEAYDEVTESALRTAKAVVVLWSKRSVVSRWVRAEATLADRNKTLVPAMIELCDRPIMFELTQTADLSSWRGVANDPAWLAFLTDVARFVEREKPPAHDTSAANTLAGATRGPESAAAAPAGVTAARAADTGASVAIGSVPSASAAPAPTGERGDAPSLAVLPFTNRSGLPEDDVFAIGMVEDIIDALSRGVYVRVIASAATARFRTGAIPDLEALSRQLGVRYILEGNVRRMGGNLRVTAQLVDAVTGAILWTQRFVRPLTERAALQEELVLDVASHLNTQVYHIEIARALKKPGDLTAWEAVMRAVAAIRTLNAEKISGFVEEARRCVALAPDYGLGHAALAMASGVHYFVLVPDDADEVRRIRAHVERALALDPNNPLVLAYVTLGLTYIGDPEEGLRHGERAAKLNSGAAFVHLSCGIACVFLDRPDEALRHLEADIAASPGAPDNFVNFTYQGCAHVLAGRWSEAVVALDRSLALFPSFDSALMIKAMLCRRDGRVAEAQQLWSRVLQAEQSRALTAWERRFTRAFSRSRLREELLALLRSLWSQTESAR